MRKINNLIIVVLSVVSYIIALYNLKRKILVRFLIAASSLIVLLVPKILRKFKIKISDNLEFAYLLFIIFAYFLGTVINFYDRFSNYDTLMHFLSGIFEAYIAICLTKDYNDKLLNLLFILGFVSLISVGWETFEFISSIILKVDPQRVETTGVTDTMKDLIVAIIGSIIVIMYSKRRIKKNNYQ